MHDGLHAALTERIIECSIEVHRHLGPGLLESIYESALCYELTISGLPFTRQLGVPLYYKGILLSEHRPDLVVANAVIVEVKPSTDSTAFTRRKC
jgi:GxxExxY protein